MAVGYAAPDQLVTLGNLALLAFPRVTKLLGWRISEGEPPFLRRILRQDQLDDASIGRCALYGTP